MKIIASKISLIYKFINCSRIIAIPWKDINIWRNSRNLRFFNFNHISLIIKKLNTCKSNIILISPSCKERYFKVFTTRKNWNLESLQLLLFLFKGKKLFLMFYFNWFIFIRHSLFLGFSFK